MSDDNDPTTHLVDIPASALAVCNTACPDCSKGGPLSGADSFGPRIRYQPGAGFYIARRLPGQWTEYLHKDGSWHTHCGTENFHETEALAQAHLDNPRHP